MARLIIVATLLGVVGLAEPRATQLVPICTGGAFQGPTTPTRAPMVGDPRNCRALPSATRDALGHGPMPRRQEPQAASRRASQTSFRLQRVSMSVFPDAVLLRRAIARSLPATSSAMAMHAAYHFAGSQTNDALYTALVGYLQVRDPDLSQSGGHVIGTYLWTPDYSNYYQTGWIDESYGTNFPRVFVETNIPGGCCRYYFDRYPILDGGQYYFATVSKPAGKYALIWWNNTWNELHPVSSTLQREGVMQQFLEVLSNTNHPTVSTTSNYDSRLVYQDNLYIWDTSFSTSAGADSPYQLNLVAAYYDWQAGS